MASSGSYARGERPRSVSDPDAAAYAAMVLKQRALNARQQAEQEAASEAREKGYWSTHPGFAESMVPVWGSAREAVADFKEGDMWGAAGNAVLAATDLAPGGYAVKGALKGGLKLGGSHTWNATRKWMGKQGMLDPGQHGHHGIIPQGGWGRHVPDVIKNQPFNMTATPSPEVHGRIHGNYGGKPRYGQVERYWRGTPAWGRSAHVWAPTGAATAADSHHERRK